MWKRGYAAPKLLKAQTRPCVSEVHPWLGARTTVPTNPTTFILIRDVAASGANRSYTTTRSIRHQDAAALHNGTENIATAQSMGISAIVLFANLIVTTLAQHMARWIGAMQAATWHV
jgi:hypothetical protein